MTVKDTIHPGQPGPSAGKRARNADPETLYQKERQENKADAYAPALRTERII